jgi:acetyltransferase-like isoleucine patch superfamily enzyme
MIKSDVVIGENCKIFEPVNLYGCKIGDNSMIGPFVEIQSNVVIGQSVKIQSHTFICSNVNIGNNVFVGHGVMFVNDKFKLNSPANGDKSMWLDTFIGDNVSIGSNATILPVKICSGTVIGAGSVVTKDINVKGVYAGNPAKLLKNI